VNFGAAISMTTCPDLKVERAINFVLFCSKDRSKMLSHPKIYVGIENIYQPGTVEML